MMVENTNRPVLIIGAGLSGLALAQSLRRHSIEFMVFERQSNLNSHRGAGWGLTLNWSLPVLSKLLPDELGSTDKIRTTCVDYAAAASGKGSRFPFFNIHSAQLISHNPAAAETRCIRVSRDKLQRLLATDIPIQWNKCLKSFQDNGQSVTVTFEDETTATGCLVVACDGIWSRTRTTLFPDLQNAGICHLPIRMMGLRVEYTRKELELIRSIDPFFFQGTSSSNGSFVYFGVLGVPSDENSEKSDKFICQICVSWPYKCGFLGRQDPVNVPDTNEERFALLREIGSTWANPFHSLIESIPLGAKIPEIQRIQVCDLVPSSDVCYTGRVVLMGDAMHAMSMYRGEGANHALVDVEDFTAHVLSTLKQGRSMKTTDLRQSLDQYKEAVISRVRPAVLASRQACLDAHTWQAIGPASPLLTRRERYLGHYAEAKTVA